MSSHQRRWTQEERERLRALVLSGRFDAASAAELLEAFAGRTLCGIRSAAVDLRPSSWPRRRRFAHHRAWTVGEDALLIELWPTTCERTLRQRLRGRSWHALLQRAQKLKLTTRWQGYETLTAACERAGYQLPRLTKILSTWHRHCQTLDPVVLDGMPCPKIRWARTWTHKRRVRLVEIGTVDLAVAHWHQLETLTQARERRGIREWRRPGVARALGLRREERRTPEQWDELFAAHASRPRPDARRSA